MTLEVATHIGQQATRTPRNDAAETRSHHMMQLVKRNLKEWLVAYLQSKKNDAVAFNIFRSLLSQFAQRHRFLHCTPCVNKVTQTVLDKAWLGYAESFWVKYVEYDRRQILKVDETAVVSKGQKHFERLAAVLTVQADGKKLPLLFKFKANPGGMIESKEIPSFLHVYAVQENA
ncbi:hypothetical protein H257_06812 [Aphanomyces astaci]|uniref:DDE-1 domain-containing protein n=1 Tax=Aphanomyces astaci TaxID=112090 RepID=W4GIR4_APHAT|nr:hypothetical protein H257_06812 [Aphanomyces astaci]ETV79547.1 hypothetical protein H257_06812 [Aphanomyces astaci]|eukprot:XP_009830483.1 hypothetical protein H257_06812 [Aphanomyces astaci]